MLRDATSGPRRGDVYDREIDLPGARASGLEHHAFVVSSDDYIGGNDLAVLISTTLGSKRQVREPFAFFINDAALYHYEQGRTFQTHRPITPTLVGTFNVQDLGLRVGYVTAGFFSGSGCKRGFGADDALRVQFQLPGRMESLRKLYGDEVRDVSSVGLGHSVSIERLSIWSVGDRENPWLVVSNDKHNFKSGYVQGLELVPDSGPHPSTRLLQDDTTCGSFFLGSSLRVLSKPGAKTAKDALLQQLGRLKSDSRDKVDGHIMAMLGLGWTPDNV